MPAPIVTPAPVAVMGTAPVDDTEPAVAGPKPTVQQLLDFKESSVKFKMVDLMATLRDSRHEGWVLAAYPDPKTSEPLIGAGFTLDLPERLHPQTDPLNSQAFIEPSSAQLWRTGGPGAATPG